MSVRYAPACPPGAYVRIDSHLRRRRSGIAFAIFYRSSSSASHRDHDDADDHDGDNQMGDHNHALTSSVWSWSWSCQPSRAARACTRGLVLRLLLALLCSTHCTSLLARKAAASTRGLAGRMTRATPPATTDRGSAVRTLRRHAQPLRRCGDAAQAADWTPQGGSAHDERVVLLRLAFRVAVERPRSKLTGEFDAGSPAIMGVTAAFPHPRTQRSATRCRGLSIGLPSRGGRSRRGPRRGSRPHPAVGGPPRPLRRPERRTRRRRTRRTRTAHPGRRQAREAVLPARTTGSRG